MTEYINVKQVISYIARQNFIMFYFPDKISIKCVSNKYDLNNGLIHNCINCAITFFDFVPILFLRDNIDKIIDDQAKKLGYSEELMESFKNK